MNVPTNHQIVTSKGKPVAVVVPYEDYLEMCAPREEDVTIPHEVVGLSLKMSVVRAWREHLGLTQQEVANRMKMSQASYSQMEAPEAKLRPVTLLKIAKAFDIDVRQLDI